MLPKINRKEYTFAAVGARNEAPLLKSIYEHPECFAAKSVTGRDHKVVAVFDTVYGGKATVVEGIFNSSLRTRNKSNLCDDDNISKRSDYVS